MLHDIGKISIDDRILKKEESLTEDEWKIIKTHPQIGYRIAMASSEFREIASYIIVHHERWDGKGYPRGLKGEEIPLLARILTVADAYDAMTSKRVYKDAWKREAALEELKKNSGTQFDPKIIDIFLSLAEAEDFGCPDV
ncbi:Cyclic di-GMP phosphodiesterase response regulator RpfG (fragment) [uncultured spirochete]|uniref:Cyclic di-GMP phosphodiesterase response regulator RpfG n=1 Tax=uncultured spirochete TaxID=156406 RepID=A0A3P3XMD7_9SPIR